MTKNTPDYVKWFRNSAPYINANRGKLMVLMLDGEAVAENHILDIVHDIALLASLGVRLVIVHGARPQIAARLAQQGITPQFHLNVRVTDPETLSCVKEAVGSLRADLEALLSMGLANSPMYGAKLRVSSGNYVIAKPIGIRDGVDFQHSGVVRRVDTRAVLQALDDGDIVLLPPLGYSPTGEVFNLFSEDLATDVAAALKADKLIFFCGEVGVCDKDGRLISELNTDEAQDLLDTHELPPDIELHVKAARDACLAGIPRAHLVSYRKDGSLLTELYTRDGSGTLITLKNFEQIRPATITDVSGIIALIRPLEKQGTLVRRSRELLESEIDLFTVIERDGAIIGCAALYPVEGSEDIGELACVAIHPDYQGEKRGAQLFKHICQRAKQLHLSQIIVLTTQTAHWFLEKGFSQRSVEELPESRQARYNRQRNSKVYSLSL